MKIRLGTLHGLDNLEARHVDLQRISLYFFVGGDLVDLVSLEEDSYIINYQVPSSVDPALKATLVI